MDESTTSLKNPKLYEQLSVDAAALKEHVSSDYTAMFREAGGSLHYPFLTPGGTAYSDVLWDWDSWLTNIALRQILQRNAEALAQAQSYERGCILNYLDWCSDGWIPIEIGRNADIVTLKPLHIHDNNMHKPVLAQHAAFLVQQDGGDAEWLRDSISSLAAFSHTYRHYHRHTCGLYYWQTDERIGVDNDPCTFFRPPKSSGSIFLNCLMVRELEAMAYLYTCLDLHEVAQEYAQERDALVTAIQTHCWDERDGFFYSVDLNLQPVDSAQWLHQGSPRDWSCLIQRIGVWSGFLALWTGVATPEQAERVVTEHYHNPRTFHAPYGIRTLSRVEKMYSLRASSNPSNWLGPIWGVSNYLTFRGLVHYGFTTEARELAEKTVRLFSRDLARFGAFHEYYQPENGEPIIHKGFQKWNYLVINMLAWLEGQTVVTEYMPL